MNIIFIDGRNLISKMKSIINFDIRQEVDFSIYNFKGLLDKVLKDVKIDKGIFYFGRIIKHHDTELKSRQLIEKQRKLKTHLENQGFEVVLAGSVRGNIERCPMGHEMLTFKEKGVDVKIAVDILNLVFKKELKTVVIASSDSDLQPVIKELDGTGVKRIYLGFEDKPNKGLSFTNDRTILIRDSEIKEFIGRTLI